jgi:hypothetical protein
MVYIIRRLTHSRFVDEEEAYCCSDLHPSFDLLQRRFSGGEFDDYLPALR